LEEVYTPTLITRRNPRGRVNIQRKTLPKIWPKKNLKAQKIIPRTQTPAILNISNVWAEDMSKAQCPCMRTILFRAKTYRTLKMRPTMLVRNDDH